MNTRHDDLPHPVPSLAFLRWKENYFFNIIDPDNRVFGVSHLNFEPGFNRARFSLNLDINGQAIRYGNQVSFPENFEFSRELTDGSLNVVIDPDEQTFHLTFNNEEVDVDLVFSKRMPAFDFNACRYAAPDLISFKEVMTLGYNLPFEHFQQAMNLKGRVTTTSDNKTYTVDSYGYRDHSWCMRSDSIAAGHNWCGLNFRDIAFGVMTIEMQNRPGIFAKEGYVADANGTRALKQIDVEYTGTSHDFLPAKVTHRLTDVFGNQYEIESDVAGRLGVVPLVAENPDGGVVYQIAENFCQSRLRGHDQPGFSLVEIGVTPKRA
jgi:hypothetical protein